MSTGESAGREEPSTPPLMALIRAVVAGDARKASELLAATPHLARQSLEMGATREVAVDYFFKEIMHYAYAGDTALHIAAAAYQRAISEELIARGANPGARNRRGAEPLHYAADGSPRSHTWNPDAQEDIVAYLIDVGADPNATDNSGVTPLHRAVRTCGSAVRALLSRGADPSRKNKSGSTPLHLAVQTTGRGGSGSTAAKEQQQEIILELLRHGARETDTDAHGKTVKESIVGEWIRDLFRTYQTEGQQR